MPSPLVIVSVLLALSVLAGGVGTLYYRDEYHQCQLSIAEYKTEAEKKKAEAIAAAQAKSDEQINKLTDKITENANKASTYVEKIVQVPVTRACVDSPAVRVAVDGVRALDGNAGGGADKALGGPPATLSGPTPLAGKPNR